MFTAIDVFLKITGVFFLFYLIFYATYLFLSVLVGAWRLYKQDRAHHIKNELKHQFYMPVSILVPAYNESVTIIDSIESLLNLDYKLYEIIVIDDGSTDDTSALTIEHFHMNKVDKPIRRVLHTKSIKEVYACKVGNVMVTLLRKENGGKADALNAGINASVYPYYICMDADSLLQSDSLERIVQPVMEDDSIVAVGGLIRVSQCVEMEDGIVTEYRFPVNVLIGMQVMEYDRSFLASRILLDTFNGNLIISGAFGLFKKDVVIAVGGYDKNTLGEDMELVAKMHVFCRNNMQKYSIRYEPNAVCWSQVPGSFRDFAKQRRRWHLGLFQCLTKHRQMFLNHRYGLVGWVSYFYYLFYELFSPQIELFGLFTMICAGYAGLLNVQFMLTFYLLYALYGSILTITAFFQRIYTLDLKVHAVDAVRAVIGCLLENIFFRFVQDFIRAFAFTGYKKRKHQWGKITREKHTDSKGNAQAVS